MLDWLQGEQWVLDWLQGEQWVLHWVLMAQQLMAGGHEVWDVLPVQLAPEQANAIGLEIAGPTQR
jgi:hypothetical protein